MLLRQSFRCFSTQSTLLLILVPSFRCSSILGLLTSGDFVVNKSLPPLPKCYSQKITGSRPFMTSPSSDEVSKAIEAAANAAVTDDQPATVFDKILTGDIPCNKVYEDDTALAFRDINPQAPVHIVVIPKQRNGLTQLSKAVGSNKEVLGHLLFVAGQIGKKECPKGFRLVVNDGSDGAQSVYHLHIHVLGGRQMSWPPG